MGTEEESTPSKPSKSTTSTQEMPTTPAYSDWSSSMQAYYGAGATPPPFFASTVASPAPHPYMWGGQNNGNHEAKSADEKDRGDTKTSQGTSANQVRESGKAASGSGKDAGSQSESDSEGTSNGSDGNNQQDERELKRQKRKQSNRESARRSRLRKQAVCEELQARLETLANENCTLRGELKKLSDECEKLASENTSIKEELSRMCGPDAVAKAEQENPSSIVQT